LLKTKEKREIPLFFVILLSSYYIVTVGQVYLLEVVCLFVFVLQIFFVIRNPKQLRNIRQFVLLLVAAWISQFLSDVINGTTLFNALRGSALIFFTLVNLIALNIFVKNSKRAREMAVLGLAMAGVLSLLIQPSTYARGQIWKFGLAGPITLIFVLVMSQPYFLKRKRLTLFLYFSLSATHLFQNARSLSLIVAVTGIIMAINGGTTNQLQIKSSRQWIKLVFFAVIGILVFSNLYVTLARQGNLGEAAYLKYEMQSNQSQGLLLSARSEVLYTGLALVKSPIFGQGSYAEFDSKSRGEIYETLARNGIKVNDAELRRAYGDRIPVHSMILQWWLFYGLGGLLFPLAILLLASRSLAQNSREHVPTYIAVITLWNTLFSPFGSGYRISYALSIIILLDHIQRSRGLEKVPL
jgi:hypothetical protein